MPYLRIETNIPSEDISKDLPSKLCNIIASSLGKPLSYCVATIVGGVNMSWGGSKEPAAQATLMSIGALGRDENKKISKAIFEAVGKELNLPNDRMYITFNNVKSEDVGYNGTTFHDIFGS
ncbi:macrophage migration inhibitory factor homolog [Harmonia axyridis]|uniref:macrophage migration inhibitory factor homolog n=1 Tax=Harmonia axyridis TaxID=115357 RepID=UPI001E278230|nr:macrophage migration inhibitory factor homolog [Harmonia axyridis]